ncbi:MAG: MarR family transcriptional regulator [Prevotella sp.]|nr:MarR family transcriptional regulator [Prevotella sp.]
MDRFERFTVLINRILKSIHKIKSTEMSKFGLKCAHVTCMYYLYREGGLTAKQLCDICGEDKAAISRAIDDLEKLGFVTCDCDTGKRYKSEILLTPKGTTTARAITAKIDSILSKASNGLNEIDRAALYNGLTIISDNLQKICASFSQI